MELIIKVTDKDTEAMARILAALQGQTIEPVKIQGADEPMGLTTDALKEDLPAPPPPAPKTEEPAVLPVQQHPALKGNPPQPAGNRPELDSEGIPWDGRIHVATKTRRKSDDTWTLKRGVDPIMVAQVKTELKCNQTGQPIPGGPATPPEPPAPAIADFPALIAAIAENGIETPAVDKAARDAGLTGFVALGQRPDLIPTVAMNLGLLK